MLFVLFGHFDVFGMFGMFSSEELMNYTGEEMVYIEKGYQFFTFHISPRVNFAPRLYPFTHARNELIGIPPQYDYERILELKDGFVLRNDFKIIHNKRELQRLYGLTTIDFQNLPPVKRMLIVECINPQI